MVRHATLALLCAALAGVKSLETVRHVEVEAGGTVHIPCHYDDEYTDKVKYLCKGGPWNSCSYKIKTNGRNSTKYSVNDEKTMRIVTFSIKNLTPRDSDYYWCNVEMRGRDDGIRFRLSVTRKGESELSVDSQWITGHFDRVTVQCKHRGSGWGQWCKVGGPCLDTSGPIDGAQVSIRTKDQGTFEVTMTGSGRRNIGWYWCSRGDLQMPVFLDLTERPITTTVESTTTKSTPSPSTNDLERKSDVLKCVIPVVSVLTLLIAIVAISSAVWFLLKRNAGRTEGTQAETDEEVTYSTVAHRQPSPNRTQVRKAPLLLEQTRSGRTIYLPPLAKANRSRPKGVFKTLLLQTNTI